MSQTNTPQLLGNQFAVQEIIGAGGMGTVYRGIDMKTGDNVAVKLLKDDAVMEDPDLVERFSREAEALRQLNHPNIVKVLANFEEDEKQYIVMEYVPSGSLSELLKTQGQMPIRWVLKLAIELADALTRAHYLKIIHRDIKPANVLIASDGTPRLTDFGVAQVGGTGKRVTRTGSIVGTPDYLPPEALNGDIVDNRSDIWAFGIVLFEMLVGQRPFVGTSLTHLITQILTSPMPDIEQIRPDAPIALIDLIYRMLEKDREARIPSIRLVGAELEAIMQGDTTSTITPYSARRTTSEAVVSADNTQRFARVTPISEIPKHNLPAQTTPFVGREAELGELQRLLTDSQMRLVTILGSGGMGKTRLALHIAEQLLGQFTDGVYFVGLAPLSAAENIIPTIADSVRYQFANDGRDQKTQLLDFLHEKHVLLVLDNYEHLMDGVSIVSDILRTAPQVKVLATSRERLNLTAENIFNLEGMDFPAWETPGDALEYSAVKLFLQGARRARPDFELDAENLPHVARISRTVQGMPLGILLAAAWVEALSVAEISDEIAKSLDFLESEMRDLPERHRSIRAVFDYSWNLLSEDERQAFMKLSVFQGGFTRQGAQNVANASLRTLTALVNKSLLRRDPHTGRYSIHVLLRQYAYEQFEQCCSTAEIYDRYLTHYADLLEKYEPEFNTLKENAIADALDDEVENIRAALHHALNKRNWAQIDRMQRSLMYYFLARSALTEGVKVFRKIGDALETAGEANTTIYWRVRLHQAWLASRLGDYDEVWKLSEPAYRYFEVQQNHLETAYSLCIMSYARMMQGDYEASKAYAKQGAELADRVSELDAKYFALANLGYAEFLHGNLAEAQRIYEDLLSLSGVKEYSPTGRAYGLNNLGEVMMSLGEFERANRLFGEAYTIFKESNQRRGMAFTSNNLASVYVMQAKYTEAYEIYLQAHKINKEIGDRNGMGHSLSALGNAAFYQGNYAEAERYYHESLALRRAMGDKRGIADSLGDLADTALAKQDGLTAEKLYRESLDLRRQIGDVPGEIQVIVWLGMAQHMAGTATVDEIYQSYQQAYAVAEQQDVPFSRLSIQLGLGEAEIYRGNYTEAWQHFRSVLEYALEHKILTLTLVGMSGAAALLSKQGDQIMALEVAALVHDQPRTFMSFRTESSVKKLGEDICCVVSEEAADAAIERGKQRDVYQTAEELLQLEF